MKLFCVHRRGSTILTSTSLPQSRLEQVIYATENQRVFPTKRDPIDTP